MSFEEEQAGRSWSISPRWALAAAAFVLALIGVLLWRPSAGDPQLTQGPVPAPKIPVTPPAPVSPDVDVKNPDVPPAPPIETPDPVTPAVVVGTKPDPLIVPVPVKVPDPVVRKTDAPPPVLPKTAPPVVVKSPATGGAGKEIVEAPKQPRTLDEAVRGGMGFLRAKSAAFSKESKTDELLLWTYIQGGVPEADADFQALLKGAVDKKLERTYNVALTAMALEEMDRVKYQKRIAQCAQFLLDNQCANGQWSYGDPSIFAEDLVLAPLPAKFKGIRKVPLTRKRDGPASGDNSNTMYALLGLRACHDAGIVLPRESVTQSAKWWRDTQTKTSTVKAPAVAPEGWCYHKHDHKPYGSMTAGGVGSLVICDYILGVDWKKDAQVASGMEWLSKNFSVSYNPGPYEHAGMEENSQHQFFYYMYGLERAAILYGTDQIGGHYWFAKGLQVLVDSQRPDGAWKSPAGGNELMDTCFAVLYLRKATRALSDVATPSTPKK